MEGEEQMYNAVELKNIKAKGWAAEYLKNQSSGLTGHLDEVIHPFCVKYWDSEDLSVTEGGDAFLGGLDAKDVEGVGQWVFYEQTGYWIDGMVRCAHLIDDEWLYEKVKPKLYMPVKNADKDGYIGPLLLKDGMVWAHTIYFRSLMAEYEKTGNEEILEALKNHFLRVPLKDVFDKNDDVRIMTVRDIADIEIALWIYEKTGDRRFLVMSEESYERFNKIYSNDRGCALHAKMRPLTVKGMLEENNARNNHGVTYCEICKLAAILYKHTGKENYKRAAINAFDKAYNENILIDGVISSSEYLNGNDDSLASHETCDVSDFTWALGYLYMITGDNKYGDWVENAVFNGGFGAVSDDFKSNQYLSCPNQVICDDHSNHNKFYKGTYWMSYAPADSMACCTGNVNRFFPNFICRSWMQNGDIIAPFVYAPTEVSFSINDSSVKINEETEYPFKNSIKMTVSVEKETEFCLRLRIPNWAVQSSLKINDADGEKYHTENEYTVRRCFKNGDIVELVFEDKIQFFENVGGISVKKGALLYALPIKEKKIFEEKPRGLNNPEYPHFSLYADSKWNYGLTTSALEQAVFNDGIIAEKPWTVDGNGYSITLPMQEVKDWEIVHKTKVRSYRNPRKKGRMMDCECRLTPVIPKKGTFECGEEKNLKLVPYCTTRLRIAIFPNCEK